MGEVMAQLNDDGVTLDMVHGYFVMDPVQQLLDQAYEQLTDEELEAFDNVLNAVGLGEESNI